MLLGKDSVTTRKKRRKLKTSKDKRVCLSCPLGLVCLLCNEPWVYQCNKCNKWYLYSFAPHEDTSFQVDARIPETQIQKCVLAEYYNEHQNTRCPACIISRSYASIQELFSGRK